MKLTMNRHKFCHHSLIGVGIYWLEIILGTGYSEADVLSWEFFALIGIVVGLIITCFWLVSIWLAKRGWLWISAIFSSFLFGIAYGGTQGWLILSGYGAPDVVVAIGFTLSFYQIYITLLGLAMPILNYFGLLAPEPPLPPKEGAQA